MKIEYERINYGGHAEKFSVVVPDDTLFVFRDGDIGKSLHQGCNHYIGASYQCLKDNGHCIIGYRKVRFNDITFYTLSDVKLLTDIPIISADEFYRKFELDKYLITHNTMGYVRTDLSNLSDTEVDIDSGKINLYGKELFDVIQPRPSSYHKILSIEGPYAIKTLCVTVSAWVATCDTEVKDIYILNGRDIFNLADPYMVRPVITKNDNTTLKDAINNVLNGTGFKAEAT